MKAIPNVYMRMKVYYRNRRVGSLAVIREKEKAFAPSPTDISYFFVLTMGTLAVFIAFSRMSAALGSVPLHLAPAIPQGRIRIGMECPHAILREHFEELLLDYRRRIMSYF
jgi:hypothetical protein